jgi:hypothetical protein
MKKYTVYVYPVPFEYEVEAENAESAEDHVMTVQHRYDDNVAKTEVFITCMAGEGDCMHQNLTTAKVCAECGEKL